MTDPTGGGLGLGLDALKQSLSSGLGALHTVGVGAVHGVGAMGSALGSLGARMPGIPGMGQTGYIDPRFGYMASPTFSQAAMASAGFGRIENLGAYDSQLVGQEALGQKVSTFAAGAGMYGAAAMGTWHLGEKAITGLAGGWKMARAGGAGVMGGVGGALQAASGPLAAIYALTELSDKVMSDVTDVTKYSNALKGSSFRFMTNAGSSDFDPVGGGFTHSAARDIVHRIREVDRGDVGLSRDMSMDIMSGGINLGMFEGVGNSDEFVGKFKKLASSVKGIMRALSVSHKEGLEVMRMMKDAGVHDVDQMGTYAHSASIRGAASGRTAAEMLSIGRQGSEMFRGTGVNMAAGGEMLQNSVVAMQQAYNSGVIGPELMAQLGGVTGAAQKSMQGMMGVLGSNIGRGAIAAVNMGGTLNPMLATDIASGGVGLRDMYGAAVGNNRSAADFVGSYVNQHNVLNQMTEAGLGKEFSSGVLLSQSRVISEQAGMPIENAFRLVAMQSGMSGQQAEVEWKNLANTDARTNALNVAASTEESKIYESARFRSFRFGERIRDRVAAPIERYISRPVEGMVNRAGREISKTWSKAGRDIQMGIGETFFGDQYYTTTTKLEGDVERALGVLDQDGSAEGVFMKGFREKAESKVLSGRALGRIRRSEDYKTLRKEYVSDLSKQKALAGARTADEAAEALFGTDFGGTTEEQQALLMEMSGTELTRDLDLRIDAYKDWAGGTTEEQLADTADKLTGKYESVAGLIRKASYKAAPFNPLKRASLGKIAGLLEDKDTRAAAYDLIRADMTGSKLDSGTRKVLEGALGGKDAYDDMINDLGEMDLRKNLPMESFKELGALRDKTTALEIKQGVEYATDIEFQGRGSPEGFRAAKDNLKSIVTEGREFGAEAMKKMAMDMSKGGSKASMQMGSAIRSTIAGMDPADQADAAKVTAAVRNTVARIGITKKAQDSKLGDSPGEALVEINTQLEAQLTIMKATTKHLTQQMEKWGKPKGN